MSNKKKLLAGHGPNRSLATPALLNGVQMVSALLDSQQWHEAETVLTELDRRYPNRPEILTLMVNLAHDQKDMQKYQYAAERMLRIQPNNPDLTLGLAGAYLGLMRPALALQTFRYALERWPHHSRAAETSRTVAELQVQMATLLAEAGMAGPVGMDMAARNEQIMGHLSRGDWSQVRILSEEALRRKPDFKPVLNNLSLALFMEGRIEQAIAKARKVLEIEPTNHHALGNLTRYLLLSGKMEESRQCAEQLKAIQTPHMDLFIKQAETLSYLGDDEGVLAAYDQAVTHGPSYTTPLLMHLAAVAAWRLGREDAARAYWEAALQQPSWVDTVIKENLDDLSKPIGERYGPWSYGLESWMPGKFYGAFRTKLIAAFELNEDRAVLETLRWLLQQYPAFEQLIPLLLDRGDKVGREFAMLAVELQKTPELLAALCDFALSQRGPDRLRLQAMQIVQEAGVWPPGPTRLWMEGEWQEIVPEAVDVET